MRMVIKFPTRGRPDRFVGVLDKYINFLSGMHEVHFVVSFDHDDHTMNSNNMWSLFNRLNSQIDHKIHPVCGKSTGKISAINADMDKVRALNPDVILLASDDMIPVMGGYDDIIAKNMTKYFPNTDGVLHFNDGFSGQDKLITLSILGRRYFERFGYLYYPGYKSVFCDNEFTDVARLLGRVVYFDQVIIQHQWVGATSPDAVHVRNESPEMYAHDKPIYDERKARNFDLKHEEIVNMPENIWHQEQNLNEKYISVMSAYPPIAENYSQKNEQSIIMSYLNKYDMKSGTLLDIGAYDGETFSNTRAIMRRFNEWKGVFVEPSFSNFQKLYDIYRNEPRRADLVNLAVLLEKDAEKSTTIEFYESPNSVVSSNTLEHTEAWLNIKNQKNEQGDIIDPRKIFVGGIGLKELLKRFGGSFDLINIDVEGFSTELALQDWFNPLDYNCRVLCVEVDLDSTETHGQIPKANRNKLDNKFLSLGYVLIGDTNENQIYGLERKKDS